MERTTDVALDELKEDTRDCASRGTSDKGARPSLGLELGNGRDGVVVQGVRLGSAATVISNRVT